MDIKLKPKDIKKNKIIVALILAVFYTFVGLKIIPIKIS